jgi:hypothetical protein
VRAVVGIVAEEVIELGGVFVQAQAEIHLSHGELVLVREQDPLGQSLLGFFHGATLAEASLKFNSGIESGYSEIFFARPWI